jgi:hypothetical protein
LKTKAKQETVMPTTINRKLYPELDKLLWLALMLPWAA